MVASVFLFFSCLLSVSVSGSAIPPEAQLPQIGNGYIGTLISSPIEFVAGVFNGAGRYSHRAAIPASLLYSLDCINVSASPPIIDYDSGRVVQNGSCIDQNVVFQFIWYAHRAIRELLVMEITITNTATIEQIVGILNQCPQVNSSSDLVAVAHSTSQNHTWTQWQITTTEEWNSAKTIVGAASTVPPREIIVAAGASVTVSVLSAKCTDTDAPDPLKCANDTIHAALLAGRASLYASHAKAWADLWTAGIIVDEPTLNGIITSTWYALLSAVRADAAYSTSPGGLAVQCYGGHAFWDMVSSLPYFYVVLL